MKTALMGVHVVVDEAYKYGASYATADFMSNYNFTAADTVADYPFLGTKILRHDGLMTPSASGTAWCAGAAASPPALSPPPPPLSPPPPPLSPPPPHPLPQAHTAHLPSGVRGPRRGLPPPCAHAHAATIPALGAPGAAKAETPRRVCRFWGLESGAEPLPRPFAGGALACGRVPPPFL